MSSDLMSGYAAYANLDEIVAEASSAQLSSGPDSVSVTVSVSLSASWSWSWSCG
ncbi:hypothetical protein GCM10009839_52260 [Catenulispora yoronensis]|uniref:Uncharacterized protein n=1 Tax=Catenulispora yoronensis TaxID=450799 RepID=A0ABP5GEG2_9ACTN